MIKYLFTLILLIQFINAKEYPKLFSQLGTPLYKCTESLAECRDIKSLRENIDEYIINVDLIIEQGFKADTLENKSDIKLYLNQLRVLEKKYDYLLHLLHENINKSIDEKNYDLFFLLTNQKLDGLLKNRALSKKAVAFYQSRDNKIKIPLLEDKINSEKMKIESEAKFYIAPEKSSFNSNIKKKNSHLSVNIKTKQTKDKIYISIENKNIYDVTVKLYPSYKNITELSYKKEHTVVVKAKSTLAYTTLLIGEGLASYKYQYIWMMGSKDAVHDKTYRYRLPFAKGTTHIVSQGFNGRKTHKGRSRYAVDFVMNVGTKVYAARDGIVVRVKSNSNRGGYSKKFASSGNYVTILHNDGSFAIYYHLKKNGTVVKVGDKIKRGEHIGYSGNTGYSSGPHLHFAVYTAVSAELTQTVPIVFLSKNGLVSHPLVGTKYTAK